MGTRTGLLAIALIMVGVVCCAEDDSGLFMEKEYDELQDGVHCDGATAGGHCWYLSEPGQTCDRLCLEYGGYDDATRTYAGSQGTDENCRFVLDVLNAPGSSVAPTDMGIVSAGCYYSPSFHARLRVENLSTLPFATSGTERIACACNG